MTARQWRLVVLSSAFCTVTMGLTAFVLWSIAIFMDSGEDVGLLGILAALFALANGGIWSGTVGPMRKAEGWERADLLEQERAKVVDLMDRERQRSRTAWKLEKDLRLISADAAVMFKEWWGDYS